MKPKKEVEEAIREKLRFTAAATLRDQWRRDVLYAQERGKETRPARHEPFSGRTIMRSRIIRLTSVAAVLAMAALTLVFWGKFSTPAYALEQTIEALQNVRFLHIMGHDKAGQLRDERWIEIGMDGYQVRYRQQTPPDLVAKFPGVPAMVIEDGQTTAVYRSDKSAVILYDRKKMQYQWVGELGVYFEDIRQNGKILEQNAQYKGRPAYKVWWPKMKGECYVDPETKLPMAIGDTELSYEVPPAGTFDIVTLAGYTVIDRRPGAAGPIPQWVTDEENTRKMKADSFRRGSEALARGDYAEAVTQFELAQGSDGWAPFWLGTAYDRWGKYDLAIASYTTLFELQKKHSPDKPVASYYLYARGLAYARSGNLEAAQADLAACLPTMIQALRLPSGGKMFEYADDPMIRYGKPTPGDPEMVIKMINRLRLITGQNFGYDPAGTPAQQDAALGAWEQWLKNGGQIKFTPDAKLIPLPGADKP